MISQNDTNNAAVPFSQDPLFSVILPIFNQAQYLERALASVMTQTLTDYEVIIVDDGSTDATPDVIRRFCHRPRWRAIRQTNQGPAGARNTALRLAQGRYLALLDADDEWEGHYLEAMAAAISREPDVGVFFAGASFVDETGMAYPQLNGPHTKSPADPFQTLLRSNFLLTTATIMRREGVVEAGGFDVRLGLTGCEDWDLWLRLAKSTRFVAVPHRLVRIRFHPHSLSVNVTRMARGAYAMVDKHFGPDDGQPESWPVDKRRAYGGCYRYAALTALVRAGDATACERYLQLALACDPTLAEDEDLFYELALYDQPFGYRGTAARIDLSKAVVRTQRLLETVLAADAQSGRTVSSTLARRAAATAWLSLAKVAYNVRQRQHVCPALWRLLVVQPLSIGDPQVVRLAVAALARR